MRRLATIVLSGFLVLLCFSCENVFHNDDLDFLWKLDRVEYPDGMDLSGKPCTFENKDSLWFSFARDLVMVEDKKSHFSAIGILKDNGNTLSFDFSMYDEENWYGIDFGLKKMGIDSKETTFYVTELNRKHLVLTGSKTVLRLSRW